MDCRTGISLKGPSTLSCLKLKLRKEALVEPLKEDLGSFIFFLTAFFFFLNGLLFINCGPQNHLRSCAG